MQGDEDVLVDGGGGRQAHHLPADGERAVEHAQGARAGRLGVLLRVGLTTPHDAVLRGRRGDDLLRRGRLHGGDEGR